MRYAYGITTALLLGGTALTLSTGVGAQVAQNEPGTIAGATPRPGAPLSFADLAARLQPAVVNISTEQRVAVAQQRNPLEEMFRQFGNPGGPTTPAEPPATRQAGGLGSGFIISPDGYVVTNNHLVQGARGTGTVDEVTVILSDRKEYKARIIGRDTATDLALLKIDAQNLPFVRFGNSSTTRVGDWVVAIGNPLGLGGTVTAGIVSAINRSIGGQYDRYIQTDAAINRGNSGGPMFDLQGNVIGINTALFSTEMGGGNIGIGFAIPASQAAPVIEQLRRGQRVQRGYLGVGPQPLDEALAESFGLPRNVGELIGSVQPGYAGARAGLQQGDVVVRINNRDVTPDETLSNIVAQQTAGSSVPIEIIRNGQRRTLTAVIGQRPSDEETARNSGEAEELPQPDTSTAQSVGQASIRTSIGLSVVTLTPQIAQSAGVPATLRGVIVLNVDPSSDAARRRLQRGDVVLSINGTPTLTPEAAGAALEVARRAGRGAVRLLVQRGSNPPSYVGVELAVRR